MKNDFVNRVAGVFGVDPSTRSTYRSPAEQQRLFDLGKTRLKGGQSKHNIPDAAIDLPIGIAKTEAEVYAMLAAKGITDAVVVRETGKGKNQGTAPHFHVQQGGTRRQPVAGNDREAGYRTPVGRVDVPPSQAFLDSLEGAVAPRSPTNPIISPETQAKEYQGAIQQNTDAMSDSAKWLDELTVASQQVQETRRERIEKSVETVRTVNDTIAAETQALSERVKPIFEKRAKVAEQLEKVAGMNWIEREFMSIFDPNYNPTALKNKLNNYDAVVQTVGQDYNFMEGLRAKLLETVARSDENEGRLEDLTLLEFDEKGKVISLSLAEAQRNFQWIGQKAGANESLIRAQAIEADMYLTERTPAELAELESRAEQSGGAVVVNGVELDYGEIRQRRINYQQQDMSLRSAQIAIERGETELADYHASQWASTATRTQLEQAIQSNGKVGNMTVPMDVLTQQLANREQMNAMRAERTAMGNPVMQLAGGLRDITNQVRILSNRGASLFGGNIPPELMSTANAIAKETGAIAASIQEAERQGLVPEVSAAQQKRVEALRSGLNAAIDNVALRQAGGDKAAAAQIAMYLRGERIDPGVASQTMAGYVLKGSMPPGFQVSPAARAAFSRAKEVEKEVDAELAAQGIKRPSQQMRRAAIAERLQTEVPKAYNQGNFDEIIDAVPALAQKMRHPFSQVSPQDYAAAQYAAQTEPIQRLADKLGITKAEAGQLMAGTFKGDAAKKARFEKENLYSWTVGQQQTVLLDTLDNSPSAKPGFKPSESLIDFFDSPQFAQVVSAQERIGRENSFGDYLAGTMSEGSLLGQVGNYTRVLRDSQINNRVAAIAGSTARLKDYRTNPWRKARVVIGSIEGIDSAERDALISALQPLVNTGGQASLAQDPNFAGMPDKVWKAGHDAIARVIKSHKFQDPNLERVRQVAAKNWDKASVAMDDAISGFED